MCLAAIALDVDARFPLVVAANRDEYFDRAAAALDWWQPPGGRQPVLAGRDLSAGGTWLALDARGRFALVTNVREPGRFAADAPSRGQLPIEWVEGDEDAPGFASRVLARGHNGFNLLTLDARRAEAHWISNRASAPVALGRGVVHAVSNAALDTPWPKLLLLKRRLRDALDEAVAGGRPDAAPQRHSVPGELDRDALATRLWSALADPSEAPDHLLPRTGLPLERERWLSPAFIRIARAGDPATADYGTRSSTLVIGEPNGPGRLRLDIRERRYDRQGAVCGETRRVIEDWPAPDFT